MKPSASTTDKADIATAAGATDVVLADGFKDAVGQLLHGVLEAVGQHDVRRAGLLFNDLTVYFALTVRGRPRS
ncbi:hypothetical protein MAHJHV57_54730 [Mycobacterium avium subsp. hominissuis]